MWKGFVPEAEGVRATETGIEVVLPSLRRWSSSWALKNTVIGIGISNRLSSRIPGNQGRMQGEEMQIEASMGATRSLLPASAD